MMDATIDPKTTLISVLSDKFVRSPKTFDDQCEALERVSLHEAMQRRWPTDAHFVCYSVDGIPKQPRLSKPLLKKIRAEGGTVSLRVAALDFDLSDPDSGSKRAWQSHEEAIAYSNRFAEQCPLKPSCVYPTRHGLRAVFLLSRPVSPTEWELIVAALLEAMEATDFPCDAACKDWTRLYRLPVTAREYGDGSVEDKWWWLGTDEEGELLKPIAVDSSALPADEWIQKAPKVVHKTKKSDAIARVSEHAPEPEDAHALMYSAGQNGRSTKTDFYKLAKRRLRGRECYDCIFNGKLLAESGQRDTTLASYVGQAISLLHGKPGVTASHIYALFFEPVDELAPDNETPDWHGKLWEMVARFWQRETDDLRDSEEAEYDAQRSLIETVKRNNPAVPGIHSAIHEEAWQAVCKHSIAIHGRDYYVIQRDGFYQRKPSIKDHVAIDLRDGFGSLIPLKRQNANGQWVDVSEQSLIRAHGFKVVDVDGAPQLNGGVLRRDDAGKLRLTLPLYSRKTSLTPCFNADVDTWLGLLGGDELRRWIAWALAFDEGPICALLLVGASSAGKSMLVRGLAECIDSECHASAHELGRFQSQLLKTPFLSIDEGMPKFNDGGQSVPDTLRTWTGGGSIPIERKGKDIISIPGAIRVIVTSNSDSVIRDLIGRRDLSEDDREAIASRLKVIHITRKAAEWLKEKGGFAFTGADGKRWIQPVGGNAQSDYVIACHFLYLHKNRSNWPRGDRFLVPGQSDQSTLRRLAIETPTGGAVVETLIRIIESNRFRSTRPDDRGFVLSNHGLFVTSGAVARLHNGQSPTRSSGLSRGITTHRMGVLLKGIAEPQRHENPYTVHDPRTGKKSDKSRWHQIDLTVLLNAAEELGHPCRVLQSIVKRMESGGDAYEAT